MNPTTKIPLSPDDVPPGSVIRMASGQVGWHNIDYVAPDALWLPIENPSVLWTWARLAEKAEIKRPGGDWQPCWKVAEDVKPTAEPAQRYPFSLKAALAGAKLVTRDGREATFFCRRSESGAYDFRADVDGSRLHYMASGRFFHGETRDEDLFLAEPPEDAAPTPPEGWIEWTGGIWHGDPSMRVDATRDDGWQYENCTAKSLQWEDIRRYRPAPKPAAVEASREDALIRYIEIRDATILAMSKAAAEKDKLIAFLRKDNEGFKRLHQTSELCIQNQHSEIAELKARKPSLPWRKVSDPPADEMLLVLLYGKTSFGAWSVARFRERDKKRTHWLALSDSPGPPET